VAGDDVAGVLDAEAPFDGALGKVSKLAEDADRRSHGKPNPPRRGRSGDQPRDETGKCPEDKAAYGPRPGFGRRDIGCEPFAPDLAAGEERPGVREPDDS